MPPEFSELAELLPITQERAFAVPLLLGVLSDTHINPRGGRSLPVEVLELFERFQVDLLVHAGDANCEDVLERLSLIAPLIAVPGNNENGFLQHALPQQVELTIGPHRVGVIHGHQGTSARQAARAAFAGRVDLAIYGHSHVPKIEKIDETIYFNPGSATDRRWNEHYGIGLIRFTETRIEPELVLFHRPEHLENIAP
jgi:putative phosphoesterase